MTPYRYSPLTIDNYFLKGMDTNCEVGSISKLRLASPIWNLFWMSNPAIDGVVDAGVKWHKVYMPTKGLAPSLTADVMLDQVLHLKLMMHPMRFAAWFERENQRVYDAYNLLGGQAWVDTVLRRARESADLMSKSDPLLKRHGNVIEAIFAKKAA
jgi:hypothetical protein